MVSKIMDGIIKFRLILVAVTALIIIAGVIQVFHTPVDTLPEFAPPYIEIQTEAPGLSDLEVEQFITFYLEGLLNGTPWLKSIRSTSVPGLSSITLTFFPGTDVLRARQMVSERLSLAYALPTVALPPVILQPLSAISQVMMIGLTSKTVSLMSMSVLAHWSIRPALLSVPGVANLAIWGMRDKQLQVEVDPQKMLANHIQLEQIVSSVGNALWVSPLSFLQASTPGSGGWVETPQQRIEIRHVLPIISAYDLSQINLEGTSLQLGQVAQVINGYQPLIGDDITDNGPGLLMVVEKFPGANTLDVTRNVKAKLALLASGLPGIHVDTGIFQPAAFIQMALHNALIISIISFVILAIVFWICMCSWPKTVISLIAVLTTFTLSILILSWFDQTINIILLSGLLMAMVIVVDDAVIRTGDHISTVDQQGIIYATLILFLFITPLFLLKDAQQAFLKPLAITYLCTLISSIFATVFLVPSFISLVRKNAESKQKFNINLKLKKQYSKALNGILTNISPLFVFIIILIISLLCLIAMTWISLFKNAPLLPSFKEPNLMIQWEGPPATSAEEMVRILTRVSRELHAVPGVRNVATEIGRAVLGAHLVDVNSAEMVLNIDTGANYEGTLSDIQKVLNGYPGLFHNMQSYIKQKTNEALTGSSGDIVVRIFGTNLNDLRNKAEEIQKALTQVKGATNIHIEQQTDEPEVSVEVNLTKAQEIGLKPGDVRRATSTWISGIETGSLFEEQKIFPVEVWGIPATRNSLTSIRQLPIDTPKKQAVNLSDVAAVSIIPTPNRIMHETVSRRLEITMDVNGRNPSAVVKDIKKLLQTIKVPLEYHTEVVGVYQKEQAVKSDLLMMTVAIALLTFLLLQAAFDSFRLATIVFVTLPFALIGGIIGIFLIPLHVSLIAIVGIMTILGIALRHSILLIRYYQKHKSLEQNSNQQTILNGAEERFTAVITTTLAAGLALIPQILSVHMPGQEIASPIAFIILLGLISSAIFNLFIVPVLYLWRCSHESQ